MPRDFPDMDSLKKHAEVVGFRQPLDNESERDYRNVLSDFVRPVDPIEASEIQYGRGWDKWSATERFGALLNASYRLRKPIK